MPQAAPGDAVKPQKFYPRYRRKTEKGTRTTLTPRERPDGASVDHVLVALRKELRARLRWGDQEMGTTGFHTVIPGLGERGIYVVALTEQDAKLVNEVAAILQAKRFLEEGDGGEDVDDDAWEDGGG